MLRSYADDNSLFSVGEDFDKIEAKDFVIVTNSNSKKVHFMCIRKSGENQASGIKGEPVLEITINNKLTFDIL